MADTFQFGADMPPKVGSEDYWVQLEMMAARMEREREDNAAVDGKDRGVLVGLDTSRPSRRPVEDELWYPRTIL